jgi:hypothetical protein
MAMAVDRLLQRRALQGLIAVGGLVPVMGGLMGVGQGQAMLAGAAETELDIDSHWRYLSGLLLAIGLGFWSAIPSIGQSSGRMCLLATIVFSGGIARLVSLFAVGTPSPVMMLALVMELVVTPCLAAWAYRLAQDGKP